MTALPPRTFRPILPPHVLRAIAQNGTTAQRLAATQTLAIDTTLRHLRLSVGRRPSVTALPFAVHPEEQRTISDAHHQQRLPGDRARGEGDPPVSDPAVNEAYDGLGATYDLLAEVYGRHSIDDENLPLDATVHFGERYDNAFWDGRRMVFGDGDGELFNRFTVSVDIIGHELAHGMTDDEGQLAYSFQPGALNESVSDVFGSLVKQHLKRQTAAEADWLIGEGLFTRKVHGIALRSLKAPGTAYDDAVIGADPQPAHMDRFVHTFEDNGGVHINSGIPNHAFYCVAMALGGRAWEKAGRIWYEALRDPQLRPTASFRRFARLTVSAAERLFGLGSIEAGAVRDAWNIVGIEAGDIRIAA